MYLANKTTDAILQNVAEQIQTSPDWLAKLIDFESGWDPQAKNPYSSARGLIQFTDTTAQSLGYESALDLVTQYPDVDTQLSGPVLAYLKQYAPFESDQKLFMSVFYPPAMTWALDREFPESVQASNPGITTVRDYVRKVWSRPNPFTALLIVAAIGGLAMYLIFSKGR